MCAENKENTNKKYNNLLQTTALCKTSMYSTFFIPHVLQGVEKISKIKKKAFMLRVLVIVQPFLAVCMHARWLVKKLREVDILQNMRAHYSCLIIVNVS